MEHTPRISPAIDIGIFPARRIVCGDAGGRRRAPQPLWPRMIAARASNGLEPLTASQRHKIAEATRRPDIGADIPTTASHKRLREAQLALPVNQIVGRAYRRILIKALGRIAPNARVTTRSPRRADLGLSASLAFAQLCRD